MGFFDNLAINKAHKAIIYLGGIILILSLFLDVKVLDNIKIIILSGITFLYGFFIWLSTDKLERNDHPNFEMHRRNIHIAEGEIAFWTITYVGLVVILLLYWVGLF